MIIGTTIDGREIITPSDRAFQRQPFGSKKAMEFEHLQHFKALVKQQHPEHGFSLVGDGADPPDFKIRRGEQIIGLELTMYTPHQRREQLKFFAKLQRKVGEMLDGGRIVGLSGIQIELSFGKLGGRPKPISDKAREDLIESFIGLTKKPREQLSGNWDLGYTPYPLGQEGSVENGTLHWHVSTVSDAPLRGSALANATGFELTYTHREDTSPEEISAQIQDCIASKDKPGADELLISAGAPDREGLQISAEAECLSMFMQNWHGLPVTPTYLKRVFLDVWGPERVFVLHNADKPGTTAAARIDT